MIEGRQDDFEIKYECYCMVVPAAALMERSSGFRDLSFPVPLFRVAGMQLRKF